jgi:alpha-glucosidase
VRGIRVAIVAAFLFAGLLGFAPPGKMDGTGSEPPAAVRPASAATSWAVSAPAGRLSARVVQERPKGALRLEILRGGSVLATSELGIVTSRDDLFSGLLFRSRVDQSIEESYATRVGKRHLHRLSANQMTLAFKGSGNAELRVQVRAATDGISYRYVLPGEGTVEVTKEASTFRPPASASAWLLPYRPNYENLYERTPVRDTPPGIYGFPALFSLDNDTWVLMSEADVDGRYAASQLNVRAGDPGAYAVAFPEPQVTSGLPLATPWRVAIVGNLETIFESDLITDLGAPSRLGDASWVRPGTVAWSWWSDGGSPRDFERQKQYVDYASEVGWEYVLVDEGWSPTWMPDLVRYAKERGVEVIVWSRWDDLETESERDALLPLWKSWGVAGVKVDFMNSDTQERMRWYDAILEDTADQKLMISFHGSTIPRGIDRTWPHVLTMEAARGAERYNLSYLTPEYNATLPFTRNVVGSMDYTPVTFSADRRETSAGHELGMSVVYESGWQHPADGIETYSSRGVAEAFLERVPTTWDQTEFVSGYPGRSATVARRSGDEWFVGSIASGPAQSQQVPLRFLPGNQKYLAEVVRDAGSDDLAVDRQVVTRNSSLSVSLSRNGGFAAELCPYEGPETRCLDDARLSRLSVSAEKNFLAPGEAQQTRVTLTNKSEKAVTDVALSLAAAQGWSIGQTSQNGWDSVSPGESVTATWSVGAPADAVAGSRHRLTAGATYHYPDGRQMERTGVRTVNIRPYAPPSGSPYLSDMNWFDSFNWVGPLEKDQSNGGGAQNDGNPITIEGQTFAKGLGGHAHSEALYYLGENCSSFDGTVGVDDEVGSAGSVVFQVWADDQKVFDSGRLTGDDTGLPFGVEVEGVEELKLLAVDAGDWVDNDHADWAGARLTCSG